MNSNLKYDTWVTISFFLILFQVPVPILLAIAMRPWAEKRIDEASGKNLCKSALFSEGIVLFFFFSIFFFLFFLFFLWLLLFSLLFISI